MSTQFLVDLGPLHLTKEQNQAIDEAIHKGVANEIAKFNLKDKIAFVPLEKSRGPINTIKIGDIHSGLLIVKDTSTKKLNF